MIGGVVMTKTNKNVNNPEDIHAAYKNSSSRNDYIQNCIYYFLIVIFISSSSEQTVCYDEKWYTIEHMLTKYVHERASGKV